MGFFFVFGCFSLSGEISALVDFSVTTRQLSVPFSLRDKAD